MGRKNSEQPGTDLVPITLSRKEAKRHGLSHGDVLPVPVNHRSRRERGSSSREQSTVRSLGRTVGNILKWSPPGMLFRIDYGYYKYWRKHPRSKVAAAGGLALIGAHAWLGISDHDPASHRSDTVQVATIEVGTTDSMFGEEAARVKNGIRSAVNTMTFHKMFDDNRRLSEIADWLSEQRGYYITVEELATLNASNKMLERDKDGNIEDRLPVDWRNGATLKLRVPGPIYDGYDVVDEPDESLGDFVTDTKASIAELRQWNPELKEYGDDAELPEGTRVQVKATVNNALVLRKMTKKDGSLRDILHSNPSNQDDILLANGPLIGSGDPPDSPNEIGYFPLEGSARKKDRPHFSPAAIRAAFNAEGDPLKITVKITGKKPPATRVQKEKAQKNRGKSNPSEALKPVDSIRNADDIPSNIKAAMLRQYPKSKYWESSVLAGQSWVESKYKTHLTSKAGAMGPAQFMPGTWKTEGRDGDGDGKKDPRNPDDAYAAQVDYMDDMYEWAQKNVNNGKLHGDVKTLAMQAYNRGAGKVLRLGHVATKADYRAGRVPTMENVEYPIKIKKKARTYGYRG
jgi:soluble lytic murein transglycosylase-like protein